MMPLKLQKKMIRRLHAAKIPNVDDYTPFPKPYCVDPSAVRAIYLGCDPSNKGGKRFCYAFALPDGQEYGFAGFVKDHQSNLKQIGLGWENVYIQNLCQNYFAKETSANLPAWKRAAEIWTPILKEELAEFAIDIPVLLTSAYLYHVLVTGRKYKPVEFYECEQRIPIPESENLLERPLIPFYRNRRKVNYHLSNPKWSPYQQSIINYLRERVA